MTRVPKFRAWVLDKEKMLPVEEIGWDSEGIGLLCKGEEDWLAGDNLVLMQSTGLKDKNGVEIYESDLIKAEGIDGLFEVRRDNGGLYRLIKRGTPCGLRALIDWIGHVEVVGNVYENKEVLDE